jgi:hypothetical protein
MLHHRVGGGAGWEPGKPCFLRFVGSAGLPYCCRSVESGAMTAERSTENADQNNAPDERNIFNLPFARSRRKSTRPRDKPDTMTKMDAFTISMSGPFPSGTVIKRLGGPNEGGHSGKDWYIQFGMDLGVSAGTEVHAAFDAHVTRFTPHTPSKDSSKVWHADGAGLRACGGIAGEDRRSLAQALSSHGSSKFPAMT